MKTEDKVMDVRKSRFWFACWIAIGIMWLLTANKNMNPWEMTVLYFGACLFIIIAIVFVRKPYFIITEKELIVPDEFSGSCRKRYDLEKLTIEKNEIYYSGEAGKRKLRIKKRLANGKDWKEAIRILEEKGGRTVTVVKEETDATQQ